MKLFSSPRALLLFSGALLAAPGVQRALSAAPAADAAVGKALKAEQLPYEVSDQGNFRIVLTFQEDKRSQLVIVNSNTSEFRGRKWRNVYSQGFSVPGKLSAEQATQLLVDSDAHVFGAWCAEQKDGKTYVYFQTQVYADATPKDLHNAVSLVAIAADEMEKKVTKKDDN